MAVVFKPFYNIALVGLVTFSHLVLPDLVQAQFFKPANKQLNFLKCGYRKKQITLKLPNQLITDDSTELEANRVERDNNSRCNDYQPPIGLTALMPSSNIGVTLADYPTFFFYIPDVNLEGVEGEFILINQDHQEIYKEIVALTAGDSIVRVELNPTPALPPLEVGKSYYWIFSLLLDKVDKSGNRDVAGWIKRVEPNSAIKSQLVAATDKAKPAIYASNGIWYEAVTSLANLRCASPNDKTILSNWSSLLQQVKLPEIAKKPLSQCN
ncbi:MAG: DUF928 domain-containing protein [Coleofasciculaceae cyanobacterium]